MGNKLRTPSSVLGGGSLLQTGQTVKEKVTNFYESGKLGDCIMWILIGSLILGPLIGGPFYCSLRACYSLIFGY